MAGRGVFVFALWSICTIFLGCVSTPKQATVPEMPLSADRSLRRARYEAYKLTRGKEWERADGSYSWAALEDLSKQFPETADIYERATTRGNVIGGVAGVGAGLITGPLSYAAYSSDKVLKT